MPIRSAETRNATALSAVITPAKCPSLNSAAGSHSKCTLAIITSIRAINIFDVTVFTQRSRDLIMSNFSLRPLLREYIYLSITAEHRPDCNDRKFNRSTRKVVLHVTALFPVAFFRETLRSPVRLPTLLGRRKEFPTDLHLCIKNLLARAARLELLPPISGGFRDKDKSVKIPAV